MKRRGSGILLHITSLPSPYGIGDLGPGAYGFADFLAEAGQSYWQVLPLNSTDAGSGNSPYTILSAFAGNKYLISIVKLVDIGLLKKGDLNPVPKFPSDRVDYKKVIGYKEKHFHIAFQRFQDSKTDPEYTLFCRKNNDWLEDFSLYVALKDKYKKAWSDWPHELRNREHSALESAGKELHDIIEKEKFLQYIFFKQWSKLKEYCNEKNIQIIGDIPIYVNYDSAELWANPKIFKLDRNKKPKYVAGVPPDYFSKTGQLWENPVYDWDKLKRSGYSWWIDRIKQNLKLFDIVRIDHFKAFSESWHVPYGEKTAVKGKWKKGPGKDFFNALFRKIPSPPIIVEDLGHIDSNVRELIRDLDFPGMKILIFSFGENSQFSSHSLHNHRRNYFVYTGNHDTNTIRGWFENEASLADRKRLYKYLGRRVTKKLVHWEMIRLAMMSVANTVIIPIQDIMGLGAQARMNLPGSWGKNWQWRLKPEEFEQLPTERLKEMTRIYGRE